MLEIKRSNKRNTVQKTEQEYLKEVRAYLATRNKQIAAKDTLNYAETIDENTFNKHGVTHEARYFPLARLLQPVKLTSAEYTEELWL